MAGKQNEFIGLKLDKLSLITLDSRAESKGMNRSEFVKYCISQELQQAKNEELVKEKLNDFERLIHTILEVNSTANKSIEATENSKRILGKGILRLQEALLLLYPDNKKLEKLFYGEK